MRVGLDVWFDPERVEAVEHDNLALHREVYAWWCEIRRISATFEPARPHRQTHAPQVRSGLLG